MTEAQELTDKLVANGATDEKVIAIINGYGDAIDWSHYSLVDIIGEVWNSDINSGEEPDNWIINNICREFNVEEVNN